MPYHARLPVKIDAMNVGAIFGKTPAYLAVSSVALQLRTDRRTSSPILVVLGGLDVAIMGAAMELPWTQF